MMLNQAQSTLTTELLQAAEAYRLEHPDASRGEALRQVGGEPPRRHAEWPSSARLRVEAEALMAEQGLTYGAALRAVGRRYAAEGREAEAAAFAERDRRLADPDAVARRMSQLMAQGLSPRDALLEAGR